VLEHFFSDGYAVVLLLEGDETVSSVMFEAGGLATTKLLCSQEPKLTQLDGEDLRNLLWELMLLRPVCEVKFCIDGVCRSAKRLARDAWTRFENFEE